MSAAGIKITESSFGKLNDGQLAKKYMLTNGNGFSFSVISFGASLQAIHALDKNNQAVNVALGFDTIQGFFSP
jgi:aldose 1-epimerase